VCFLHKAETLVRRGRCLIAWEAFRWLFRDVAGAQRCRISEISGRAKWRHELLKGPKVLWGLGPRVMVSGLPGKLERNRR
jgi:hypothetical protein